MEKSEKQNKFKQKAYPMAEKAIRKINRLQNYANRYSYDYSALEVMAMFSKIEAALKETREKYIYELQREEGVYYIEEEDDFDDDDEE